MKSLLSACSVISLRLFFLPLTQPWTTCKLYVVCLAKLLPEGRKKGFSWEQRTSLSFSHRCRCWWGLLTRWRRLPSFLHTALQSNCRDAKQLLGMEKRAWFTEVRRRGDIRSLLKAKGMGGLLRFKWQQSSPWRDGATCLRTSLLEWTPRWGPSWQGLERRETLLWVSPATFIHHWEPSTLFTTTDMPHSCPSDLSRDDTGW